MVTITVDVRAANALAMLDKAYKRMPYAIHYALNNSIKHGQKAVHAHVASKLIIRRPAVFFGTPTRPGGFAGKIEKATPTSLSARLYTGDGSKGKGGPVLLPGFERGDIRKPVTAGAKVIAVPITGRPARPSISRGVPPAFTIAALKLRQYVGGKRLRRRRRGGLVDVTTGKNPPIGGQGVQIKGLQRTFVIRGRGILQRFGPERGDIRTIYAYIPPFPLEIRIQWTETAKRAVEFFFPGELKRQVEASLEFHLNKGR